MLQRLASHRLFFLALPLAAPGASAAQGGPVLLLDEDVGVAGSAAMPIEVARNEQAALGGVQGQRFVFFGESDNVAGVLDDLTLAGAVDAAGRLLWTWIDDQAFTHPLDLCVPRDGDAAYGVLEREQERLEVRRFNADGTIGWEISVATISDLSDHARLACSRDGGRLFLQTTPLAGGFGIDRVLSLDPATGGLLWAQGLPIDTAPRAIATDDAGARVFALVEADQPEITSDRVLALDGATGAILWTANVSNVLGYGFTPVTLLACEPDGALVYVASQKDTGGAAPTVLALEGATGEVVWSASVPDVADGLVVDEAGPYLYVLSLAFLGLQPVDVHVTRLRIQTGDDLWTRVLPLKMQGTTRRLVHDPVLDRLALSYTTSTDVDLLIALDVDTGGTLWEVHDAHEGGVGGAGALGVIQDGRAMRYVRARRADPDGSGDADLLLAVFAAVDGAPAGSSTVAFDSAAPTALGLAKDGLGSVIFALARDAGGARSAAAFERADLAPRWQVPLGPDEYDFGNPGPGERIASTPDGAAVFASRVGSFTFEASGAEGLDGASGALLWNRTFDNHGNVVELLPGPANDAVFLVHDGDAQGLGWPSMRALDAATGTDLWVERWPPTPTFFQTSPAGALTSDGSLVGTLVSEPPDPATLVVRSATGGTLVLAAELHASDFGIPINQGRAIDVEFAADGASAFTLAGFLGGTSHPASFGLARVEIPGGAVAWGVELAAGLVTTTPTEGELFVTPDGEAVLAVVRMLPGLDDELTLLVAADADTGAIVWQSVLGEPGAGRAYDEAALDGRGDTLLVSMRDLATGSARLAAVDTATGTSLWEVELSSGTGTDLIGALLAEGGSFFALSGADSVLSWGALTLTELLPEALVCGPDAVSLAAPQSAVFLLDRPAGSAGAPYLVLGSASGTTPGIPLGPSVLPLVLDGYLLTSLTQAGQPPFLGTLGLLDAAGDGRAELAVPPGLAPSLAGLVLHHAFIELKGGVIASFASEPVALELVP